MAGLSGRVILLVIKTAGRSVSATATTVEIQNLVAGMLMLMVLRRRK